VREVLGEVGAEHLREIVVINKADIADEEVLARLTLREPNSIVVSMRTGNGLDKLTDLIAEALPRPRVSVDVLVPYDRGDLVSRVYRDGQVLTEEHTATGTRLHAQVRGQLAGELEPFAV
jgi:GTPase